MRWLAGLAVLACSAFAFGSTKRTNIIIFLVDDLGWQDLSVPMWSERTPFNDRYNTPNLEKLATNGTVFTNAYSASPVCTPTRTSIMTGKAPARNHITYWTIQGDTSANDPLVKQPRWQWEGLEAKDGPFLPQKLRDLGYRTIHVGKAHFGAVNTFGANPKDLGFDINIAGHAAGHPGSYYGLHNFMNAKGAEDAKPTIYDVPGLEAYHGKDIFLTEALTLEARRAIRESGDQPFYLNFCPYAVHTPIQANPRYLFRYAGLDPKEAAYATLIESYDAALGGLMEELKATGKADQTVIIFTSDNGGLSAHARGDEANTHNRPLKSGKGSFYEGGIRVPFILKGRQVAGSHEGRADMPIISHDLHSLALRIAGSLERTPDQTVEFIATDETIDLKSTRPLVWHTPHFWGVNAPGVEPHSSINWQGWKLIYRHRDRGFELYNLTEDISEAHNLADQRPVMVRALARKLDAELTRMGAQWPTYKESGQPVPTPAQAVESR